MTLTSVPQSRRIGRFTIEAKLLHEQNTAVLRVFACCFILECRRLAYKDEYEYYAISDHFDELPPGREPYEYVWLWVDTEGLSCHKVRA